MITNPIYKPFGAAGEYADYALNIYEGCPHGCWYCYAKSMAKRFNQKWTNSAEPRAGIVEAVEKQLMQGKIKNKTIHLCFTCDPYPTGRDTTITKWIIKLIKQSGNNVQILTKNCINATLDLGLLDKNDWFGTTITGQQYLLEAINLAELERAQDAGIKTWISFEPVLDTQKVFRIINSSFYDKAYVGALTGYKIDINYKKFANMVAELNDKRVIIKNSLRGLL